MADEATNITLLGNQGDCIEVIVATGTAIAKNTLMQLTGDKTCTATSGGGQKFLGILKFEKTTTDGITKVSLITHCLADLTCGAAETMEKGVLVKTGAAANEVTVCVVGDGNEVEDPVVGMAQEDVAGNGIGPVLINVGHSY